MERMPVFTEPPSLAEQVFCMRPGDGLTDACREVIGTVERLTAIVTEEQYDETEAAAIRQHLHRLGVSDDKLQRFFAARFVLGCSVNPEQELAPELATLRRIGFSQSRIEALIASGEQVANFCKQHDVAADHVIITTLTQGQAPSSLVLPL